METNSPAITAPTQVFVPAPAFTLAPRLPGSDNSQATIIINAAMAKEITDIIDECCDENDKALFALARQLENFFVRGRNPLPRRQFSVANLGSRTFQGV